MAGTNLTNDEIDYIKRNCAVSTDREIAKALKRNIKTIRSWRSKLGIIKDAAGKVTKLNEIDNPNVLTGFRKMSEEGRQNFFKTQLTNTLFYQRLKEQLTDDEIDFYMEEWGALCVQFEDIVATEKRQIDELIKAEILGNRILRNIKVAEEEISNIQDEIDTLRDNYKDTKDSEEWLERDQQLMNLIRFIHSQSQAMTNEYQKNVESRNKILSELNARRRDRIDQIKKGNTTFVGLVENLRNDEMRSVEGRYAELLKIAQQKLEKQWRHPARFPDGSKDCIVMDAESHLPVQDNIVETFVESKIFNYFVDKNVSRILVVDDDHSRQQFFTDTFKTKNLFFASSVEKAQDIISSGEYALIMLDYDIGMNETSERFVRYMLEGNYSPKAKIIIHSMNPEGAKKLGVMLAGERDYEICPIVEIMKFRRPDNAEESIDI